MNDKNKKRKSKFLSLVLRHNPGMISLSLDKNGWANLDELIDKASKKRMSYTQEEIEEIVKTCNKQRFALNDDKTKIRANQGHSLKTIDLELEAVTPPEYLYHGTVAKFMENIRTKGLLKMSRQHVHMSKDLETAINVGSRRGKPIILNLRTGAMHKDGYIFHCSKNGVWLTNQVPVKYIDFKQ